MARKKYSRQPWWHRVAIGALSGFLFHGIVGCSTHPPRKLDRWLLGTTNPGMLRDVSRDYVVRSPDIIEFVCDPHPDASGPKIVGVDGTVDLGSRGKLQVDGRSVREITRVFSEKYNVPEEVVFVRVVEHRSQFVFVFGEVAGLQRAVPYQGPETVLELIKRIGGLTRHAAPEKIQVVRPHIAEGLKAEVFPVDLTAILDHDDHSTNIIIQPLDQVYVGQTRRSVWQKCLPPWMQSLFQTPDKVAPTLEPFSELVEMASQVMPDQAPLPGQKIIVDGQKP